MKKIALLYDQVSNENYKSFCTIDRENTFLYFLYYIEPSVYLHSDYIKYMINLNFVWIQSQPVDIFDESQPWWRGRARRI